MGRELQKKKNRSGLAKVRQTKPKAAEKQMKKKILANPIIAANWDHTQTLSQNYKRLGLARKLNTPTGGIERNPVEGIPIDADPLTSAQETHLPRPSSTRPSLPTDSLAISSSSTRRAAALIPRDVRIERNPVTGAILRILDEDEDVGAAAAPRKTKPAPWAALDDALAEYDSDSDSSSSSSSSRPRTRVHRHPNPHHPHIPSASAVAAAHMASSSSSAGAVADTSTSIVSQLTAHALASTLASKPRRRTTSTREAEWIRALVERHGEDYEAMARDKRLNVRQQTGGDIKRRVARWREGEAGN